jgi:hypothetical protein
VLVLTVIAVAISAPLIYLSSTALRTTTRWRTYDSCFLIAQSAMEEAKYEIFQAFESYYDAAPLPKNRQKFLWFDTFSSNSIGNPTPYVAPQGELYTNSQARIWVSIRAVREHTSTGGREVLLRSRASMDGITREIEEMVRYAREPSEVFDYAYFINNFGWFWGNTITANGDVRANGDFSFGSFTPTVNGDAYASANTNVGAVGSIAGSAQHDTIGVYQTTSPNRARPTDPPATNVLDWLMGYDGQHEHYTNNFLDMPYLGDLSDYEWLANRENGTISQAGSNLVTAVYSGAGPDGVWSNADDGVVILDGSIDPVVIDGPVVVPGDVIIKGQISGQGTIYAGRNIHIVGDVIASNPPSWTKPDAAPHATVTNNNGAALLCLAAKGNIVIGDYTESSWRSATDYYLSPSFVNPYNTDPTDAVNGYDSDNNPSNGWRFAGDYRAFDGGLKVDASGTNSTNRRYYESSISDTDYHALAGGVRVARIDAVLYNNHVTCGLVGSSTAGLTVNGAIVGRDEALIYQNRVLLNWDIRIGSRSQDSVDIDIFLPETLGMARTCHWKER